MASVGELLGNYRLLRKLGSGGFGAVFEAEHLSLGRRAAIKVLHRELAEDPEVARRFLNEARAVNVLRHPGIVDIYEFSRLPDGTLYAVMELLTGEPLSARVGRLALPQVVRLGRQIAEVMAVAHGQGIIHRDLKPENVMLVPDPGQPGGERIKILDFGIAKVAEEHLIAATGRVRTRTGEMLGTPAYMAPEQGRGAAASTDRTDVYALGVMLYEMLSGATPFPARSPIATVLMHLQEPPPPLSQRCPQTPAALTSLVHAMLAKEPLHRPRMTEVAAELARIGLPEEDAADVAPGPGSHPAAQAAPARRFGVVLALAGGLALALSLLAVRQPARPARVRWSVHSLPAGAEVMRAADGHSLGRTPWEQEGGSGEGTMELVLRLAGHTDRRISLDRGVDAVVREVLEPARAVALDSGALPDLGAPTPAPDLGAPQGPERAPAARRERVPPVHRPRPPAGDDYRPVPKVQ